MSRTPPTLPYLPAPADAITAGPWILATPDGESVLPEAILHWDPHTDLHMRREVEVDLAAVRQACGLHTTARIGIACRWRSDRTRLRGSGGNVELGALDQPVRVRLHLDANGPELGGDLELTTALVLRDAGSTENAIAAQLPGSMLWSDSVRTTLEGGAARFPASVLDFAETATLAPAAAWSLEWPPDALDQPALGAIRLLINSRNERLVAAVSSGARDPESEAIRSMIRFDVARTLIHGALSSDEVLEECEFEPDSVGRMLRDLLEQYWPVTSPRALESMRASRPQRFESEIQGAVRLLT